MVAWNAMLAAYVHNCLIDEACNLFDKMPERNAVSYTTMISGFVSVGKLDEAKNLLDAMPYKNVGAQTAMISGYVQHNTIDEGRKIFDQMSSRDIGFTQNGNLDESHSCRNLVLPDKGLTFSMSLDSEALGRMSKNFIILVLSSFNMIEVGLEKL
nr:pentatricopeptide repeat-containing protein At4g02750-like [Ipomoea batatas]